MQRLGIGVLGRVLIPMVLTVLLTARLASSASLHWDIRHKCHISAFALSTESETMEH